MPISPPRQPSYEPPGRPMPSFSDMPISPPRQPSYDLPGRPMPPYSDMPVLFPTQPQYVPSVGIIKEEEEEEDTTEYSNVGRVIKKKRKLG
jgi:hypothetical protein